MREPGLDRHEWEGEYHTLEPLLDDDPFQGLPEFADLVERMLDERGFQLDDPVAEEGDEKEVVTQYRAAREVADRVEQGANVDPGDVGAAIVGLRELYEFLISERSAP